MAPRRNRVSLCYCTAWRSPSQGWNYPRIWSKVQWSGVERVELTSTRWVLLSSAVARTKSLSRAHFCEFGFAACASMSKYCRTGHRNESDDGSFFPQPIAFVMRKLATQRCPSSRGITCAQPHIRMDFYMAGFWPRQTSYMIPKAMTIKLPNAPI